MCVQKIRFELLRMWGCEFRTIDNALAGRSLGEELQSQRAGQERPARLQDDDGSVRFSQQVVPHLQEKCAGRTSAAGVNVGGKSGGSFFIRGAQQLDG